MHATQPGTPTQAEIGEHLDMDQSRVSRLTERGVLSRGCSLDEARREYIRHLREQAAGRGGDGQSRLVDQRARQAEADAQLKELEYWTRIGKLVAVEDLQPLMESWSVSARASIENAVERILTGIESQHGIEIDRSAVDAGLAVAYDAIAAYPSRRDNADAGGESVPVSPDEVSAPHKEDLDALAE